MNNTKQLKNVRLILDENEICTLDTIINTVLADYPNYAGSRDDVKVIREKIRAAVSKVI
jgi:hypothetical protein